MQRSCRLQLQLSDALVMVTARANFPVTAAGTVTRGRGGALGCHRARWSAREPGGVAAHWAATVLVGVHAMPFDDQPAGVRGKSKPTGKKSTGAESVLKMVRDEQVRADLVSAVRAQAKVEQCSEWHVKSERNTSAEDKRRREAMASEMELANREIKMTRQAKLRELYAQEAQQYQDELASMGLAVERERQ